MAIPDQSPDPHGALAWLNAIFETLKQAYAALLIPTAAGIAWFVRRSDARRDDAQKRADARRESEEEAHQRISDQLDLESAKRFDEMRADVVSLKASVQRLEAEKDVLLGQRRWWFDRAHDMRHDAIQELTAASNMMQREGLPPLKTDLAVLPYDLNAPAPDRR